MTPSLDARARFVAAWLADRFAEDPTHMQVELDMLARTQGIVLAPYWHHPAVEALEIRSASVEITPGNAANCWTTLPEGDDES